MTITVEAYTGSQLIGTVERTLTGAASPDVIGTLTDAGIFQAFLDLNALVALDVFEFRIYEKTKTGGTQRQVFSATFANAQGTPIWASPSLVLGIGWDMTLVNIAGAARTIDWRISKIA
jgi:hypothetical protein